MMVARPSAIPLEMASAGAAPELAELLPPGSSILVPLDFSPLATAAVETTLRLAGHRTDVTLCFVNVVNNGILGAREKMKRAWGEMERVLAEVRCAAHLEKEVLSGPPASVLCERCARGDIALVVMTSHGRTGLARMIMGSVAEAVVQDAPVPVLVVKPRVDETGRLVPVAPTFKHLIVGYDHRPGAAHALDLARGLARTFRSRITLVHALEPVPALASEGAHPPWRDDDTAASEALESLLEVCAAHLPEAAGWRTHVAVGCACDVLRDVVKDAAEDVIIVGPHELTRWGHCFTDSSAGNVARLAHCAVLVAR